VGLQGNNKSLPRISRIKWIYTDEARSGFGLAAKVNVLFQIRVVAKRKILRARKKRSG
jgi:hypothetical protein